MKKKYENGFSLVELLIGITIIAMVLAVATFSYTPAMRSYRAKKGIQDFKAMLSGARIIASRRNIPVLIHSYGNQRIDMFIDKDGNNSYQEASDELLYCLIFTSDTTDPGRPANVLKLYEFEPLTILSSQTRTGQSALSLGFTVGFEGSTSVSSIPFLTAFQCRAEPNGFLRIRDAAGNEVPFGAVLCVHSNDVMEGNVSPERHYALAFATTGWMKTYHLDDETANWVEY
ncbi:MAG: prepilin-type N-terminal cleavage/methylation domain-containing protein [Acidobacteria bacterium]|nr:prepilin-type N-terminal cleavage/methylation domain-containing protein [Acidobacteriota bacterium]